MSAERPERSGATGPEAFSVVAADGTRLAGFRWWPASGLTPVAPGPAAGARASLPVVIVHGVGEHLGRHRALAERLAAAGRLVVGADLRGHGRSEGRRGHVEHFDDYLDDLDLVVAEGCRETGASAGAARAPVLLGHSLGALIVLRHAERRFARASRGTRRGAAGHRERVGPADRADEVPAPAGLVLASIGLQVTVAVPWWKLVVGRLCERLLPTLTFRTGIDPEVLSTDPGVAKAYREDPLAHSAITPRWYTAYEAARAVALAEADAIRCPVLVLHGLDDRIADAEGSRRLALALRQTDVTLRFYRGARHELFSDPAAHEAFDDLEAWLRRLEG